LLLFAGRGSEYLRDIGCLRFIRKMGTVGGTRLVAVRVWRARARGAVPSAPKTLYALESVQSSERIFSALDIRPAGAAFLENAGWNYCVFTKQLVPIFGTCPGGTRLNGGRDGA
jgi:hypothetical protein